MKQQSLPHQGFTLTELVIVIGIVAILAAVAIPKLIDIKPEARQSATQGVAGALNTASAFNYGVRKANASAGSSVANCTDVGPLMSGGLPSGYTITSQAISPDARVTCTVTNPDGTTTATFVGIGIS